jgi:hypothetical protein
MYKFERFTKLYRYIKMGSKLYTVIRFFHSLHRHYATSRKVAGSIPDEVIFLNFSNSSSRTRPKGLLSL